MLRASNITFSYDSGSPPLLLRWSHTFTAGEVVALSGPSGCGKSTLLYLLGLMLRPHAGHVTVNEQPASHASDAKRARLRATTFGFVFQDSALDPTRTILDNVTETALYRGASRRETETFARQLLSRFDVELRAEARPTQVSGGQAQRIALCRALVHRPSIVLADEPTGNLDPVSRDVVVAGLQEHAENGATIVIVTHDREVANRCHRVVQL